MKKLNQQCFDMTAPKQDLTIDLRLLALAAKDEDPFVVRNLLALLRKELPLHAIQAYVEFWLGHDEEAIKASKFVHKHAHCKCGNLAVTWSLDPKCSNCHLKDATSQIKYTGSSP